MTTTTSHGSDCLSSTPQYLALDTVQAPLQSAVQRRGQRAVAGTLFGNAQPRLVEIFGIAIEADLDGDMLYIVNSDAPGFIGSIGTLLGAEAINIGTFHLGRRQAGGEAVLLLSVDSPVTDQVLAKARKLNGVRQVKALKFA